MPSGIRFVGGGVVPPARSVSDASRAGAFCRAGASDVDSATFRAIADFQENAGPPQVFLPPSGGPGAKRQGWGRLTATGHTGQVPVAAVAFVLLSSMKKGLP